MKSKILIIDDDSAVLEILSIWFEDEGFEVKSVLGTDNIFQLLERFHPDVILLDYLLKGDSGGEICLQIKDNHQYQHLPVVIFSVLSESAIVPEAFRCDAFIPKPFDLYLLTAQLNDLIFPVTSAECADWC